MAKISGFSINCAEDFEAFEADYAEMQELLAGDEPVNETDFVEFEKDGYVPTPEDFAEMGAIFSRFDEAMGYPLPQFA